MHGEYKTPRGKMVVVDFEVEPSGDTLRDVMVSGDFFLYPEESLEDIATALEGLSTATEEGAIAETVAAAIPEGTEMLGFSPEAIAIAVRRGLDQG